MVITPRLSYVHAHRTGGSFIEKMLLQHYGGRQTGPPVGWRHDSPRWKPTNGNGDEVPMLGSIRNPFAYYVSRWQFLRERKQNGEDPVMCQCAPDGTFSSLRKFLEFYVRPNGPRRGTGHAPDLGPMRDAARLGIGHSTHEILELYTGDWRNAWYDHPYENLQEYWKEEALVDMIVHQESLVSEFAGVLQTVGYDPKPVVETDGKVNAGPARKHYSAYYTDRTRGWVEEADRFLLDVFEYEFEQETEEREPLEMAGPKSNGKHTTEVA